MNKYYFITNYWALRFFVKVLDFKLLKKYNYV